MKNLIQNVFFLALFLFALSCKEDLPALVCTPPPPETEVTDTTLTGNWQLIATSGGFSGQGYTPYLDQMLIDTIWNFSFLKAGEILVNGRIEEVDSPDYDFVISFITTEILDSTAIYLAGSLHQVVYITNDTLNLFEGCPDCYGTHFKRME